MSTTSFSSFWSDTLRNQLLLIHIILFETLFLETYSTGHNYSFPQHITSTSVPIIHPYRNTGSSQSRSRFRDALGPQQVTYHPQHQITGENNCVNPLNSLMEAKNTIDSSERQRDLTCEYPAQYADAISFPFSVPIPESARSYKQRVLKIANSDSSDAESHKYRKRFSSTHRMHGSRQSAYETLSISIAIQPIASKLQYIEEFHRGYRLALLRRNQPSLFISFVPLLNTEIVEFAPYLATKSPQGYPINQFYQNHELLADTTVNHSQCLLYTHRGKRQHFKLLKSEERNILSTTSIFTAFDLLYKGLSIRIIPINLILKLSTEQERLETLNKVFKEYASQKSSMLTLIFGVIGQDNILGNTQQIGSKLLKFFPGFDSPDDTYTQFRHMMNKAEFFTASQKGQSVKSEIVWKIKQDSGINLEFQPWLRFSKKAHIKHPFAEIDFVLRVEKNEKNQ